MNMPPLRRPDVDDWLRIGGISLVIHIMLVILLSLNPWPVIIKARPTAYTVTLMPVSLPEPEPPKPQIPVQKPAPLPKKEIPKPVEKPKPVTPPRKDDIVEKVKKPPPKIEKPEEKKVDLQDLQEKLEEIRRKAALEEIQKRVASRQEVEKAPTVSPPAPMVSSSKPSAYLDYIRDQYYSIIWAKIKESWTIPKNLLEERVDLETIIVITIEKDGTIRKHWFEKKSGNDLYDQMALRAIRKAEPLPSIPDELSKDTLEVGIRFFPD